MDFNGYVYACDHFVFPEYRMSNIQSKTLKEMMYSEEKLNFGNDKSNQFPQQCRECDMLFACYRVYRKNRFINDKSGNQRLKYPCNGY